MTKKIPVISFVGYSGSGKTTLLTKIIKFFKEKKYRIATIKHDAHNFQMDYVGKDTYKFTQSGSDIVMINSKEKFAVLETLSEPVNLKDIINKIVNVDIILVEGYKNEPFPKIILAKNEAEAEEFSNLLNVIAIASSEGISNRDIPVFNRDDYVGIAELIETIISEENNHGI